MESIIEIIFIIALLKFCLKAAMANNFKIVVGYSCGLAIFALALYPLIITQPLTILSDMLANKTIVENMALLTTAESVAGIMLSVWLLDNYFRPREKRTHWAKMLKIIPAVVVFFAVAYFELLFFKWRVGGDFLMSAILYSGSVVVGVCGIAMLLKWLLGSESARLELKLILNLSILVLGLLVSSSVADYNTSNAVATIEWKALIAIIIGSLVLMGVGAWLYKIDFTNRIKILLKWNK